MEQSRAIPVDGDTAFNHTFPMPPLSDHIDGQWLFQSAG